jgi:hypothetical protein
MKKGKALERLIAGLEKVLADNPNVQVESPKRLPDRTTGALREYDVVLTVTQGHHVFLIAIECRDRSRPITVNQVEGFNAKCQDTGIGQGIIVSTAGFYDTARKKANHLGIKCLDLEGVESFDWISAPGVHAINRRLIRTDWMFWPRQEGIVEKDNFEVVDENGNVLTMDILNSNAQEQLKQLFPKIPEPVEKGEITVRFPGSNLSLRNTTTGETVPVEFATAKIHYSDETVLIPFKLVQYKEKSKGETITDAAYADLTLGDHSTRLFIVYNKEEGGKVVLVPQGKPTPE